MGAILTRGLSFLLGYLFGLFNTGKLISLKTGHDLNNEGSKNSGATNAFRVLGFKAGLLTFLGDSLKAIIPMLIIRIGLIIMKAPSDYDLLILYVGFGALIGHVFPITRKFKGGKGVSTTAGIVLAFTPLYFIIPITAFICLSLFTGYVSLGSITAYIILFVEYIVLGIMNYKDSGNILYIEQMFVSVIIPLIGIYKHKENIIRLINKNENRFNRLGSK